MGESARETLTYSELCTLFHRTSDDTRWISSADSQEWLALVTYLVQRSKDR